MAKKGHNYCRKCKLINFTKNSNQKFFLYEFNKQKPDLQNSLNDSKLTNYTKFEISPIEKIIFGKLNFAKFHSIEHLTRYLIHSNDIRFSQLIFTISADLKKLPQIKYIINTNQKLLPFEKERIQLIFELSPIARSLQLVYSSEFWEGLLVLYITKFHPICPYFNLKTFDQNEVSPQLMSAIYYCGYFYRQEQPEELSEYMELLANRSLKKIFQKPSLNNIQALLIFSNIFQLKGDLKLSRACTAQLTRMAYILGIQIETKKFQNKVKFDRKLIHRRVAVANYNMSGSLKIYPNYLAEQPIRDETLNNELFDNIPSNLTTIKGLNIEEFELTLKLSKLANIFCDDCLYTVQYTRTSNKLVMVNQLERSCKLLIDFFKKFKIGLYELSLNYTKHGENIKEFSNEMHLFYYDMSLGLLNEYINLDMTQLELKPIRSQILQTCTQMTDNILLHQPNFDLSLQYYCYLVTLHYFKLINYCSDEERCKIYMSSHLIIERLKSNFLKVHNLNYLIILSGLKIIKNKFGY